MKKKTVLAVISIIFIVVIFVALFFISKKYKIDNREYVEWKEPQTSYVEEVNEDIGVYYEVTDEVKIISDYLKDNGFKGDIAKISVTTEEDAGTPVGVPDFVLDSGIDHYYSLYNTVDDKYYDVAYINGEVIVQESKE